MILVFGKTGQVGMELQQFGGVVTLGRMQADLRNPSKCANCIRTYAPRAVINAAAYTAVDGAEKDEAMATIVNGDAPKAMAQACVELGIPLIHISTDYVFDGTGDTPWVPYDLTAPQNAYGRSKLAGEIGIRESGAVHAILRTSWVISSHGKNFVTTMLNRSATLKTINVVADQIGGPTPARDIAETCLQIAEQLIKDPTKCGTYHYSGVPDVSWADFASAIFDQVGMGVTVAPILTKNYPTPAKRPLNSRMNCITTETFFGIPRPEWRKGLNNILQNLEDIT